MNDWYGLYAGTWNGDIVPAACLHRAATRGILPLVTQAETGRFAFYSNHATVIQQQNTNSEQSAPYYRTHVPAACVTTVAGNKERFVMSAIIVCRNCGGEFSVQNKRINTALYCSMACRVALETVPVKCETCGKDFRVGVSRAETIRYCSRECRKTGAAVPCSNCGNHVYRQRHQLGRQWTFCSLACESQFTTGLRSGSQHPNFITLERVADFSPEQKELIIGMALGDASILKNSQGNAHLSVAQGEKQLAYLQYKHRLLEPYSRPIKQYDRFDKRHGRSYRTYRFFLPCHPFLTGLHNLFYPAGVKDIPQSTIKEITPRSFAFWFMDDGSANHRGRGGFIASCAFSEEAVGIACDAIWNRLGVMCWPVRDNRIYLSAETWGVVADIVRQFSIPEMEYKIS